MNHQGTKTIESTRLLLRKFCEDDIEKAFANWTSDPLVTPYLRWQTHTSIETTKAIIHEWIEAYHKPNFYQWAIVLKEINEPIGSISIVDQNETTHMLHVGYCIGSKWWKQGITSEAFQMILPYLFEEVKANRIETYHEPDNVASGKVMEKCGLTYEGTLRKQAISNQGLVDACMYSILKSEYDERKR